MILAFLIYAIVTYLGRILTFCNWGNFPQYLPGTVVVAGIRYRNLARYPVYLVGNVALALEVLVATLAVDKPS